MAKQSLPTTFRNVPASTNFTLLRWQHGVGRSFARALIHRRDLLLHGNASVDALLPRLSACHSVFGHFTADHMGWLTSSEKAHFIWAVLAMVVAGFVYHKLNHLLYSVSQRIYAIVSFPIVVVSSLILMLNFALKLAEEVAPNLADDPTIEHAIYIVFAIIIAVLAWRKRQTAMARLHSPANIVLTNGNVMVVESTSAMPTSPYTPQAPTPAPSPGPAPLHTPPTTFSAQPGANSGPKKY